VPALSCFMPDRSHITAPAMDWQPLRQLSLYIGYHDVLSALRRTSRAASSLHQQHSRSYSFACIFFRKASASLSSSLVACMPLARLSLSPFLLAPVVCRFRELPQPSPTKEPDPRPASTLVRPVKTRTEKGGAEYKPRPRSPTQGPRPH
jgi:hypothetical protein